MSVKITTYARFKAALAEIARCPTIEQAGQIAREALRSRIVPPNRRARQPCAECGLRRRGFNGSRKSKFCSGECRDAYVEKKRNAKRAVKINPQESRALEMREAGMTYEAIGRVLGVYSGEAARRIVKRAIWRRRLREEINSRLTSVLVRSDS